MHVQYFKIQHAHETLRYYMNIIFYPNTKQRFDPETT